MQKMQGIHNQGTLVTKVKCYVMARRVIRTSLWLDCTCSLQTAVGSKGCRKVQVYSKHPMATEMSD
jgi:hypothetical protein